MRRDFEIGIGLQSDKRAGDYARLARIAEEHATGLHRDVEVVKA